MHSIQTAAIFFKLGPSAWQPSVWSAPVWPRIRKTPERYHCVRLAAVENSVSIMSLGGHASTNPKKLEEQQSLRLIRRAVDEGITFLDNCWDYHDGVAEERDG